MGFELLLVGVVTFAFNLNLPFMLPVSAQSNSHSTTKHSLCLLHSGANLVQTQLQPALAGFHFCLGKVAILTLLPNLLLSPTLLNATLPNAMGQLECQQRQKILNQSKAMRPKMGSPLVY